MTGRGFGRDEHPEELLSASVSGDISSAERAALDVHLAGCDRCRATLEAFREERHLISGLREVPPPRDLGARVRAGIEGRAPAVPWWRRPSTLVAGVASLATVAAALLAVVVLSGIPRAEVGNATPTASTSAEASTSETPTLDPSESGAPSPMETSEPTSRPAVALAPGELGFVSADGGEPASPLTLSFTNDETGVVTTLGEVLGPPVAAAISPTGEFLAYITEVGLSGVNQVAVARLSDGKTEVLGCTARWQFADRLAWSDDGRFLGYTLSPVDLGDDGTECGGVTGDGTTIDAWVYDAGATGESFPVTEAGNAFAADFAPMTGSDGDYKLLVSYAGPDPYTEEISVLADGEPERIDGRFLPLFSPDGQTALYWSGVMEMAPEGGWHFVRGGLPYATIAYDDGEIDWTYGEPFFDLEPMGGSAFEGGQLVWSDDGQLAGFWGGEWTGPPQSADGSAPTGKNLFVRRMVGGRLDAVQRAPLELEERERLAAVTLDGVGATAYMTVVKPAAGDLSLPTATLYRVPLNGDEPTLAGIGAAWTGPAVIGEEAVRSTR